MTGETYLGKIQNMTRTMQNVVFVRGKKSFNNSEMRMLEEIVAADKKGERLISTELADKVGVTGDFADGKPSFGERAGKARSRRRG